MRVKIVPAQQDHVVLIRDKLRPEAELETQKIGPDTEKSIKTVMEMSDYAWTGFADDKIACMWGLQPLTMLGKMATLWLITTPEVERHSFHFVRWSQRFIEELKKSGEYTLINGCVRKDFARSVSWIRWLGFTITQRDTETLYFKWEKQS